MIDKKERFYKVYDREQVPEKRNHFLFNFILSSFSKFNSFLFDETMRFKDFAHFLFRYTHERLFANCCLQ